MPMAESELLAALLALPDEERQAALKQLSRDEAAALAHHWRLWARRDQLPPPGDWQLWLIMAGRGFGKTRAGAEWVRALAAAQPAARIALVAASLGEARAVMVEGESGVMNLGPPESRPRFEPSLRRISWANGAQATLYSAQEPESLRGPQHSHACGTSPEEIVRQRVRRPIGHAAALRNRRHCHFPATFAGCGVVLVGRHESDRCLSRAGRQLVVCDCLRRHAPAQQGNRAGNPLSLGLANALTPRRTGWWIGCRCGSAGSPECAAHQLDSCRGFAAKLTSRYNLGCDNSAIYRFKRPKSRHSCNSLRFCPLALGNLSS